MSIEPLISTRKLVPYTENFDFSGDGLDIDIHAGEVISLLGPDYSGKSDWLSVLAGASDVCSGEISFTGKNTRSFENDDWVDTRKNFGLVKFDTAILSAANALQNVMLPAHYHDIGSRQEITTQAHDLLAAIGLKNLTSLPAYLRKDQCFKVAIARALILNPAALFLNNPFMRLDAQAASALQQFLLQRVSDDAMSLVVITHDVKFAIERSNRILFITQDAVKVFDKANRIEDSDDPAVATYLNNNRMIC